MSTEFELITFVVQRGKMDKVIKEVLKAGAAGATMFFARGTGVRERLKLMGIFIQPEKEVAFIITKKQDTEKFLDVIVKAANLDKPGQGIVFVQPVSKVVGFLDVNNENK